MRLQHAVAVTSVRFDGAARRRADARRARGDRRAPTTLVIAPSRTRSSRSARSSPFPASPSAVAARRDRNVAVSPIVGGKALKGPADRMLRELGHEASRRRRRPPLPRPRRDAGHRRRRRRTSPPRSRPTGMRVVVDAARSCPSPASLPHWRATCHRRRSTCMTALEIIPIDGNRRGPPGRRPRRPDHRGRRRARRRRLSRRHPEDRVEGREPAGRHRPRRSAVATSRWSSASRCGSCAAAAS